jgi:hypothetical protein
MARRMEMAKLLVSRVEGERRGKRTVVIRNLFPVSKRERRGRERDEVSAAHREDGGLAWRELDKGRREERRRRTSH